MDLFPDILLRLLNYFYVLEAAATSKDNSYVSKELSKGDIKELESSLPDFCRAIKSLSKDPKDFEKELAKLPDVTVGPMSEVTLTNVGSAKLDPINIFSMNGFISPIYRIGMMVANYQVARYKEAVELKTNLELRKIFLEGLQANGQADAVVQKEIEIIQSRIDNCAEQIERRESRYVIMDDKFLVVYQRGFIGVSTPGLNVETNDKTVIDKVIDLRYNKTEQTDVTEVYNLNIVKIYRTLIEGILTKDKLTIVKAILVEAIRGFGSNDFAEWLELQRSQDTFLNTNKNFILDTLRFY